MSRAKGGEVLRKNSVTCSQDEKTTNTIRNLWMNLKELVASEGAFSWQLVFVSQHLLHAFKNRLTCVFPRESKRHVSRYMLSTQNVEKHLSFELKQCMLSHWSFCSVDHSTMCWSSLGYFGAKEAIVERFWSKVYPDDIFWHFFTRRSKCPWPIIFL